MIGGGGAFGSYWGGGGAGACIIAVNQLLPAGDCAVYVGAGGIDYSNGGDSYIQVGTTVRYSAKGGGGAGQNDVGGSGGCGSGAGVNFSSTKMSGGAVAFTNIVNATTGLGPGITSTYAILGNIGGSNGTAVNYNVSGSGGGIGGAGLYGGGGGDGAFEVTLTTSPLRTINFREYFANNSTSFGVESGGKYYIGAGGSAVGTYNEGIGKGSSGSGGDYNGGNSSAKEGIIIIRYRTGTPINIHTPVITTTLSTPALGTPSIELVRGTRGDANTDYKIGNYNGDFIIKSSVSNTDTDYLRISSTGAITNPTGTASWNTGSDRRIKENIERASYDKCYESISRLELNRFNYIKGFNTVNRDITQLGFIAQEVNEIFPKAISSQPYYSDTLSIPDLLSIDVSQINYALYGTVKKLIEIYNKKDLRLKNLECLLNLESDSGGSSNVVIIENVLSSNML
jgi:hypothetical protein